MHKQLISAILLISAGHAWSAEQFTIPAGNWEMTTTTTTPFAATPMTRTRTECQKQSKTFDPAEMLKDAQDCRITDQVVSSNKMTFKMHCSVEGGEMHGSGQYEINGNQATGSMEMIMQMQGQTMKMQMEMQGKRLGDC